MKTVFVSGSAETYEPLTRNEAIGFIHSLARNIIIKGFRIVNGFGWGVGSAIINGSLEAIYSNSKKLSENQLVLKPFPQFKTGNIELKDLWEEYRQQMIKHAGISLFVFGNKNIDGEIVDANGVWREFEISKELGNTCIPIGMTGYVTHKIYLEIAQEPEKYYSNPEEIIPHIEKLADDKTSQPEAIKTIIDIINILNK